MAATYGNREFIPKEELDKIAQFNTALQQTKGSMLSLLPDVKAVTDELGKQGNNYKQLADLIDRAETIEKRYRQGLSEQDKIKQQIIRQQERLNSMRADEGKQLAELRAQIFATNKANYERAKALESERISEENRQEMLRQSEEWEKSSAEATYESAAAFEEAERMVAESIAERGESIAQAQMFYDGLAESETEATSNMQKYNDTLRDPVMREAAQMYAELTQKQREQLYVVAELEAEYKQIQSAMRDNDKLFKSGERAIGDYSKARAELTILEDSNRRALEGATKALQEQGVEIGKYDSSVMDLNQVLRLIDPSLGMMVARVKQITPLKQAWITTNDKLVKRLGVTARTATILQASIVGLIVGAIYLGIKAFQAWQEEQQRVADLQQTTARALESASISAQQSIQGEITKLELLYNATQDAAKGNTERLKAVKELQTLYPQYLGNISQEEILAGGAAAAYGQLRDQLLKTAQARAYADKITELYKENIELEAKAEKARAAAASSSALQQSLSLKDYVTSTKQAVLASGILNRTIYDQNKLAQQSEQQMTANAEAIEKLSQNINIEDLLTDFSPSSSGSAELQKRLEAERRALRDYALFITELESQSNKQIASDNEISYEERLNALANYLEKQKELISNTYANQATDLVDPLIASGLSREQAEEQVSNQLEVIWLKRNAALSRLTQEGEQISTKIVQDEAQKRIKIITDEAAVRAREIAEGESNALAQLAEAYAKGELSAAEYEQRKTDVVRRSAMERFDAEEAMLLAQLNNAELTEEQRAEIEKRLADSRLQYQQYVNSLAISDYEKMMQSIEQMQKQLTDRLKQLWGDVLNTVGAIMSGITQRRLNDLDKQSEANEEWANEETERIERLEESGAIAAEEAEARKRIVSDEAAAREEELEGQRREAQRKQAIFNRGLQVMMIAMNAASSVFQIKASVAAGILAALEASPFTGGQPWAGIIAATGASQIATVAASAALQTAAVLSAPLPEYAQGTSDHGGGGAILGDGGKKEVVLLPTGKSFLTPDKPTAMNLPKHTMVFPDVESYSNWLMKQSMNSVTGRSSATPGYDDKRVVGLLSDNVVVMKDVKRILSVANNGKEMHYNILFNRKNN